MLTLFFVNHEIFEKRLQISIQISKGEKPFMAQLYEQLKCA